MNILGISCYYHDAAAALLQDGELMAAAEEERFTRKKHDFGFPAKAIEFCLSQGRVHPQDLDYVVFYEKPLLKFERILMTSLGTFPRSWASFRESMVSWFKNKLWIKGEILRRLSIPAERLLFVEHHLSHAASAFFASPFQEAAILTVDGVGEWTTATLGRATADWDGENQNRIDLFQEVKFPHSLGLLYSAFTAFLGFEVNEGKYKVMGMAPYGRPNRLEDVYRLIEVGGDGSFRLNMDYFCFHHSASRTINGKFESLFGKPRHPEADFYTHTTHPRKDLPGWDDGLARSNQRYADIAASIQGVTEEILIKMARHVQEKTGLKKLCIAGGVGLNSAANGRLMRELPFEDIWIQPASGDSGGALGAALYVYHVLLGKGRKFVQEHSYWGKSYSSEEMEQALRAAHASYEIAKDEEPLARSLVADLVAGKVVGLFQGRFEWGPRALGNRSILADPRRAEMKDIVNTKIKFREPFRPFAPAVLEDKATDYYEGLSDPQRHYPLRYMLMVFPVKEEKKNLIPAVTHAGGTGRIQTIRREWNPLYYRIVERFAEETGVPVVLNTSFNLRGEPIVGSPTDALNTFQKSGLDSLYMGPFVIRK